MAAADIAQNAASTGAQGAAFGPWGIVAGAAIGAGIGYLQHRKGMKDAKRIDEMGLESFADKTLPEFRDVENKYRDIAQYGLGSGEANTFMNKANSAMFAQQLNMQSMAGGSLAKYSLAMNNANIINAQANLASQNFARQMQGLQGYNQQLQFRQGRTDRDIEMENRSRQMAGQAAANLSSQGLSNIAGAVGAGAQMMAYTGGFGGGGGKWDGVTMGERLGNETITPATVKSPGAIPMPGFPAPDLPRGSAGFNSSIMSSPGTNVPQGSFMPWGEQWPLNNQTGPRR